MLFYIYQRLGYVQNKLYTFFFLLLKAVKNMYVYMHLCSLFIYSSFIYNKIEYNNTKEIQNDILCY